MGSKSIFANLAEKLSDEVNTTMVVFSSDPSPSKILLAVGAYRDKDLKPWVLPSVQKAEKLIVDEASNNHEYLPNIGSPVFLETARELLFGDSSSVSRLTVSVQTVSGTGALQTGARFLAEAIRPSRLWLPNPTWGNHSMIWQGADPLINIAEYPYYNANNCSLAFDEMIETLQQQGQPGDILLLQACAHNPTGCDLSKEQWKRISTLCRQKDFFPMIDIAYQGLASGSLDDDAWCIRHFADVGLEFGVAQSFSKNFGLYGERVGAFHLITCATKARDKAEAVLIHLQQSQILTPPTHGAKIVSRILTQPDLRDEWQRDLDTMGRRISSMRASLYQELVKLRTPGAWEFIIQQTGMFSYIGLNEQEVLRLRENHHLYILPSGRLSIPSLNEENVASVARGIDAVIREREKKLQVTGLVQEPREHRM